MGVEGVAVAERVPVGGVGAPGRGEPTSLLLAEVGFADSLQEERHVSQVIHVI